MGQERRRYPRYNVDLKVSYTHPEMPDKKLSARAQNISLGGVGLSLNVFLDNNEFIDIHISVPRVSKPVHLRGKVVWQEKASVSSEIKTGLVFADEPDMRYKRVVEDLAASELVDDLINADSQ